MSQTTKRDYYLTLGFKVRYRSHSAIGLLLYKSLSYKVLCITKSQAELGKSSKVLISSEGSSEAKIPSSWASIRKKKHKHEKRFDTKISDD